MVARADAGVLPGPLRVRTGVAVQDPGWRLVDAAVRTLVARGVLAEFLVAAPDPRWPECAVPVAEPLPFLEVGPRAWPAYDDALVPEVYEACGGNLAEDHAVLNAWIRAFAPGARRFLDVHAACACPDVLASLVERGGDILLALRDERTGG